MRPQEDSFTPWQLSHLKDESCPELSGNVGVPYEEVDDASHNPTARRFPGVHPRSEDHDLFSRESIQCNCNFMMPNTDPRDYV